MVDARPKQDRTYKAAYFFRRDSSRPSSSANLSAHYRVAQPSTRCFEVFVEAYLATCRFREHRSLAVNRVPLPI